MPGPAPGWMRVRINLATQAYPAFAPGATIQSIDVVYDEGTEIDGGFAIIDNIDVNGVLAGRD